MVHREQHHKQQAQEEFRGALCQKRDAHDRRIRYGVGLQRSQDTGGNADQNGNNQGEDRQFNGAGDPGTDRLPDCSAHEVGIAQIALDDLAEPSPEPYEDRAGQAHPFPYCFKIAFHFRAYDGDGGVAGHSRDHQKDHP